VVVKEIVVCGLKELLSRAGLSSGYSSVSSFATTVPPITVYSRRGFKTFPQGNRM
jgi:hypothetical protein